MGLTTLKESQAVIMFTSVLAEQRGPPGSCADQIICFLSTTAVFRTLVSVVGTCCMHAGMAVNYLEDAGCLEKPRANYLVSEDTHCCDRVARDSAFFLVVASEQNCRGACSVDRSTRGSEKKKRSLHAQSSGPGALKVSLLSAFILTLMSSFSTVLPPC